jgi:uncharacterized protein (TIGR02001 family)
MSKSRVYLAGVLLAASVGVAQAGEFSVTPAVVSDYDFRGTTQTDEDPAFQLGLSYTADSGFYVGAWGSNVDFGPGDPDIELDVFAGYAWGDSETSFGYDVGVNFYTYPSASEGNFAEVYFALSRGPFTGKLWYTWDFLGLGEDAFYLEGNLSFPLPAEFSLDLHAGYSFGAAWDDNILDLNGGDGYVDFSVGVSRSFGNFDVSLKYTDGSDWDGYDGRVVLGVSTTLPWAN